MRASNAHVHPQRADSWPKKDKPGGNRRHHPGLLYLAADGKRSPQAKQVRGCWRQAGRRASAPRSNPISSPLKARPA